MSLRIFQLKIDISFSTNILQTISTSLSWTQMENYGYLADRFIDSSETLDSENMNIEYDIYILLLWQPNWKIFVNFPEFSDFNFFATKEKFKCLQVSQKTVPIRRKLRSENSGKFPGRKYCHCHGRKIYH